MYIRVTLYWGHWTVLWLFHLVCILCCGCFDWFCDVVVCVCVSVCVCARACVGFVMCGCFGNICTCIYCVLYSLYCDVVLFRLRISIVICFICTGVRTTATGWQLSYCKNNNNNNNNCKKLFKLQIRPPSLILLITASQDRWIFPSQSWEVRNSMIIITIILLITG